MIILFRCFLKSMECTLLSRKIHRYVHRSLSVQTYVSIAFLNIYAAMSSTYMFVVQGVVQENVALVKRPDRITFFKTWKCFSFHQSEPYLFKLKMRIYEQGTFLQTLMADKDCELATMHRLKRIQAWKSVVYEVSSIRMKSISMINRPIFGHKMVIYDNENLFNSYL